jgi:hypothetical protein
LRPVSVSVPLPTLVSAPPVPPPPPALPSLMTPETVVLKLLLPTVSVFAPRKYLPAPSIEPAVMPAEVSADISKLPPALVMKRALPPVLVSRKLTVAPLLVVTVALPAVLDWLNWTLSLLVMLAVPAELKLKKAVVPLLIMPAPPAVLEFWNWSSPLLVMLTLPPVMLIPAPLKVTPPLIVKLYADVPVKFQAPSVVRMEIGILLLALVAKVAVPLGVAAGVQLADVA